MKKVMKGMICITMFFSMLGCKTKTIKTKEAIVDQGVEVSTTIKKEKHPGTGFYIYECTTTLKNQTEEDLMNIYYALHLCDQDGNELDVVNATWNGQDTPLKPNESVKHEHSFQVEADARTVKVTINEVKTASEQPPIHLPQKGEALYQAINDEYMHQFDVELPIKIEGWIDQMGAVRRAIFEEKEDIQTVVDAFKLITIEEESQEWVTDNYNGVIFTFADGHQTTISFNLKNYEMNEYGKQHIYTLSNLGPYWQLIEENSIEE